MMVVQSVASMVLDSGDGLVVRLVVQSVALLGGRKAYRKVEPMVCWMVSKKVVLSVDL